MILVVEVTVIDCNLIFIYNNDSNIIINIIIIVITMIVVDATVIVHYDIHGFCFLLSIINSRKNC